MADMYHVFLHFRHFQEIACYRLHGLKLGNTRNPFGHFFRQVSATLSAISNEKSADTVDNHRIG
jgi:hypothetical protein